MELKDLLTAYKGAKPTLKPNFLQIPCTVFPITEEGMNGWNRLYKAIKKENYKKIIRTKSGGICKTKGKFIIPSWDFRSCGGCWEITLLVKEGFFRFQFRRCTKEDEEIKMSGKKAFMLFKEKCLEEGIDLEDYAIKNGEEVKKTIPAPKICIARDSYLNRTFDHVYHLDFHNSYPSGLCYTHPEFTPIVKHFYDRRKDPKVSLKYKAVLNYTIGFMQRVGAPRWANLSKDAITNNNVRIDDVAEQLTKNGYIVLLYNTDGIWYADPSNKGPFHGRGEGDYLGLWSNDHFDCTFRAKSNGTYEYIEDGKYHPVVRGRTKLDRIKDRSVWNWGDIYQNLAKEVIKYNFTEDGGIEQFYEES